MLFINEAAAINGLADTIIKGGVSLYNAMKYIYSIAEEISTTSALKTHSRLCSTILPIPTVCRGWVCT